jgi:two-component system sensor histidine kinase YesM
MTVDVDLFQQASKLCVCIMIQDDGQGFDSQVLDEKKGLGLTNVRERLRIAFPEGDISVSSQVNCGTKVIIKFPATI